MALVTVTPPTSTPVSLSEAKEQCRVTESNHDGLITRLIKAAEYSIESYTGARLSEQTVQLELDGFPSGCIDLGVYPVTAITSVLYDDTDDVETAMVLDTDYWKNLGGMYPALTAVESWPATKYGKPASVRILMTVGYAASADVPQDIRHAILLRVKEYFDNAGESVTGAEIYNTVSSVDSLAHMHRRIGI